MTVTLTFPEYNSLRGRDLEIANLAAAVRAVVDGRGQAILIEGEAGIGKTALLASTLAEGIRSGCRVLHASADELTARFPLQFLFDAVDPRESDSPPVAKVVPVTDAARPKRRVGQAPPSLPFGDPVTGRAEQILCRIDELCALAPTVLAVDDLQWADDSSLAVLSRLSVASNQMALLVIATCRPLPHRPELARLRRALTARNATILTLTPLSGAAAAELASQMAGAPAGPGLRDKVSAAGGNPLYVREIVDALTRDGSITTVAGVADIAPGSASQPISLKGAIADRLAFLTPDTRRTLRLASLLGHHLAVTDLAALAGLTPVEMLPLLDEAVDGGVLASSGERLVFRHTLIRDSLYESIPEALRAALHRQAAQALAATGARPERVAAHLMSAPAELDAWTAAWLAEHGDALAARMPGVVEELLSEPVERPLPNESLRDELELLLLTAAFRRRSVRVVHRVGERILLREIAPDQASAAAWMLGFTVILVGRPDDALRVIGDMVPRAPDVWASRLRALGALALLVAGKHHDAFAQAEEILRAHHGGRDKAAAGYCRHVLAMMAMMGCDTAKALRLIDEALADIGDDMDLAHLRLALLVDRTHWADRTEDGEASIRAARALVKRAGSDRGDHVACAAACLYYSTGRWDDAVGELVPETIPRYEPTHQKIVRLGVLGLIAARRDQAEDATRHLAGIPDEPVSGFVRANSWWALNARVVLAERKGDFAGAAALLAPALTEKDLDLAGSRYSWVARAVRVALAAGDTRLARRAADTAVADAIEEPDGIRGVAARWCGGILDDDVAALDACGDFYRDAGFLPNLADVRLDAAVVSAIRGDIPGARRRLGEAVTAYADLGAEWELRRADARLRALGVRRRAAGQPKRPDSGWEALTKTETRVAELVADGCSNPDIAGVLFLSRRTVENHVARIFAKLRVRSRGEVAREAPSDDAPSPRRTGE